MANISKGTRLKLKKSTFGRCGYCGILLEDVFEIDHVIAKSRGGTGSTDNLLAACFNCNRKKGDKLLGEFKIMLKKHEIFRGKLFYELLNIKKGAIYIYENGFNIKHIADPYTLKIEDK